MIREVDLHDAPFPPHCAVESCSSHSRRDSKRFLSSAHSAATLRLLDLLSELPPQSASALIASTLSIPCTASGLLHGVALWYSLALSEHPAGDALDTGPLPAGDRYWRQVVFLSERPQQVEEGSQVSVTVLIDRLSGVWCHLDS
jgi:hypothetical protein